MGEDYNKPKRKRRVNEKRQALKTARKQNPETRVWSVCINTTKDLWKAFVLDCSNKTILASGSIVKGRNKSYASLREAVDKQSKKF